MIAELSTSIVTTENLLMTGLMAVAGVVAVLWKLVLDRNRVCEAENAKMLLQITVLQNSLGKVNGTLTTLVSLMKSCKTDGCALAKININTHE